VETTSPCWTPDNCGLQPVCSQTHRLPAGGRLVETIENRDRATIGVQVLAENGNTILNGGVQNGSFHGVKMS
jgi:hypothetical protein